CSGTGTVRRNPEIKWRLRCEGLKELATLQRKLLSNALDALAPGGRLVYSTCSLEREENEEVVAGYVTKPASREKERLKNVLTEDGLELLGDPYFRVMPSEHGSDGYFAAIIEKN